MGICGDFLEWIGNDMSVSVMKCLKDPADLVRISSVSRAWRRFTVANSFCKELCLELFPETSMFTRVEDSSLAGGASVGSSDFQDWRKLECEHKTYAWLVQSLLSPPIDKGCIQRSIAASSTDNYPDESIDKTLQPCHGEDGRFSYWSSEGEISTEVPETLTYYLNSRLCVVHEVNVHPFQAFFQVGYPMYSAKSVRFKLGYPKVPLDTVGDVSSELISNDGSAEDNYRWTYISPLFSMTQQNHLQIFKLPNPVLCIGGILQIEFLGRIQKQQMDDLYYICVCHVQVVGRPLQEFDVDIDIHSGQCGLKYFPGKGNLPYLPRSSSADETASSVGWLSFAARIRQMRATRGWNLAILRTLLGDDEDSDSHGSDDE